MNTTLTAGDEVRQPAETEIQYRCEWCRQPITDEEPGRAEIFARFNSRKIAPRADDDSVSLQVCHNDCVPRVRRSMAIALPRQLRYLGNPEEGGDNAPDTLASWLTHLKKQSWWFREDTWDKLDSWVPVEPTRKEMKANAT